MNKEDCHSIQLQLSAYLDRELDQEKYSRVQTHLRSCSACSRELQSLERTQLALFQIKEVPETADQWSQIRSRLEQRKSPLSLGWLFGWPRWVPLTVSLFVGILLVSIFWPFSASRNTDIEPYLGLYLLAANASDVFSTEVSLQEIGSFDLGFSVHAPPAVGSWIRKGIYSHKLHGEPLVQVFYTNPAGHTYCVFQQSAQHFLDFGQRETQQELVENQICTKLANRHFNLISWSLGKTLFTLVSTAQNVDQNSIAADWIGNIKGIEEGK